MSSADDKSVAIWCDGPRVELIRRVLGKLPELRIEAVGGPGRGPLADLADALGVKPTDDLRKMLIDFPSRYLLLATVEDVGPAELKAAREGGTMIVSLEPLDRDQLGLEAYPNAMFAPALRASPGWISAAEPLEVLGRVRSIQVTSMGPRWAASLYARLHEAVEMLAHLLGSPLTVDACLSGGPTEPPDRLAAITGDLTAHLRFGTAAAVLHASDHSPLWSRRVSIRADAGQLTFDDLSYSLVDASGKMVDGLAAAAGPVDPADLIARQWRRQIEGGAPPIPADPVAVEACCEAALLSCRTGQLESTGTLMRMRSA